MNAYSTRCNTILAIIEAKRRTYRIDHEYGVGCVKERDITIVERFIAQRMGFKSLH
jgi:hypothetical protein